jgi:uncharacterized protein (DUF1778 family)
MRSIHVRVSDHIYGRILEEAEDEQVSVAQFTREAVIARATAHAVRRGERWTDTKAWDAVVDLVEEIDGQDAKLRAERARRQRS